MESCNDYSITFAKGLVLKTPAAKRAKLNGTKTPWTQAEQKKSDLLKRLQEAEQQQDFFSGLYRQYTTNLRRVIYVRSLVANERVREYLQEHHAQQLEALRADHQQHGAVTLPRHTVPPRNSSGEWRNAVLAAGPEPAGKCWTKQLVIREIRARHNRGLALTSIVFKEDGALAGTALPTFRQLAQRDSDRGNRAGNGHRNRRRHRKQAGLGQKRRRMDKQEIIEALRQRHAAGLPPRLELRLLGRSDACYRDKERLLRLAASIGRCRHTAGPVRTSTIRKWDEKVIIGASKIGIGKTSC